MVHYAYTAHLPLVLSPHLNSGVETTLLIIMLLPHFPSSAKTAPNTSVLKLHKILQYCTVLTILMRTILHYLVLKPHSTI